MHHGQRGGALALGRSALPLTNNLFYHNAMAGVSARGSAALTLRHNQITDGKTSGVHVSEGARALVEENLIRGNRLCGVELEPGRGAELIARRNALQANGGGAFSVGGEATAPGRVLLEENEVVEA